MYSLIDYQSPRNWDILVKERPRCKNYQHNLNKRTIDRTTPIPQKVGGEIRFPKDYRKWSRSHSFTLPQFNILNMYSCETKSNEVIFWIISMSIHQFIRCSADSSVFIIVWLTKYFISNQFQNESLYNMLIVVVKIRIYQWEAFYTRSMKILFWIGPFWCFHLVILVNSSSCSYLKFFKPSSCLNIWRFRSSPKITYIIIHLL